MDTLRDLDLVRGMCPADHRVELRSDSETGMPIIRNNFSPFGSWYEIDSIFEGKFLERSMRGAFKKTMQEGMNRIRMLFDHGMDPQIGNKVIAPIDKLAEGSDTAYSEGRMLDTTYNRDLLPGLEAGVYGSSFRFRVIVDEWNDEPGVSDHNPKGIPERTLREVKLFEAGPVTFPANQEASSGVRCLTDEYYGRVRMRDPSMVEDLLVRSRAARTPLGVAVEVPAGPAIGHPSGMTARQRRAALYPFLRG